jgi:type IV pilus assembly protein PilA
MHRFKHHRFTKGFTLIELMLTVAMIAILVVLAVPAYSDYQIRAKIAECINGAAQAKLGISEYRITMGAWPPSLIYAGFVGTGISPYCTGIDYDPSVVDALPGSFTIDINEDAVGSTFIIAPIFVPTVTSSNIIKWNCAGGNTDAAGLKYLPSTCRDQA